MVVNANVTYSRFSRPPVMKPAARSVCCHFLSSAAISLAVFAGFGQIASAQATLLESAPGVNPTKLDQPAADHLFGDWGGFRTWLANAGITYTLDFTSESVYNASGGLKQGGETAYQIGLAVDADWQKLAGLTGFSTHMILINRGGGNASANYVGDTVLQAQEIFGAGFSQAVSWTGFMTTGRRWLGR
jgi:carbohydrate-selective porin OprB